MEDVLKLMNKAIDDLDPQLKDISRKIHSHPELGYQEVQAHDNVVALLCSLGFKVQEHVYRLEMSFSSEYGTGGCIVTFNVEYNTLPGIGHACRHNLIAMASIAAFLGVVAALKARGGG